MRHIIRPILWAIFLSTGCSSFSATINVVDAGGDVDAGSLGGTSANATGTTNSGGAINVAGATYTGGTSSAAGATAIGGTATTGGVATTGGTAATAGASATGGVTAIAGASATGGLTSAGGSVAPGGTATTGGVATTGGIAATAGASATGGVGATGGAAATGGTATGGAAATGGTSGCNLSQTFGSSFQVVPSSLASQESGMSVSADGLTAIVSIFAGTSGTSDLKLYARSSLASAFGNQQDVPGASNINTTTAAESSPRLSRDGFNLFYTSVNATGSSILLSTRTSASGAFGAGIKLPATINMTTATTGAWIDPGNAVFYWGSGGYNIYSASITGLSFSNVTTVTELSSSTTMNGGPVLSDDQLTVYFYSDRTDASGNTAGTYNRIWKSARATANTAWGTPSLVTELDPGSGTVGGVVPLDLSPDGCRIYYVSQIGSQVHLYQATKGQ